MRGIATLFTQAGTVKPYKGINSNTGPAYDSPVNVMYFVNDSTKLIRDSRGEEVVSSSSLYCALEHYDDHPPQSQVTVNGRTSTVLHRYKRDSAGPASAWHTQVELA